MSKSSKGEGIKIAQAAKDLGVTSVTIRRYISEFDIETTSDENGIKVLPEKAMEEMYEVRRLKEEGLTNPQVLEHLEEMRAKPAKASKSEAKKPARRAAAAEPAKKEVKKPIRASRKVEEVAPAAADEDEEEDEAEEEEVAAPQAKAAEPAAEAPAEGAEGEAGDGRSKHSLTCQTCGKTFEHMNPRLRDCLECYRAKRKERRRDKHKNVIQHPLAAQVASKQQQRQRGADESFAADQSIDVTPTPVRERGERFERGDRGDRGERGDRDRDRERGDRGERGDRDRDRDRGERGDRDRDRDRDRGDRGDREGSPLPMSAKRVNPLAGTHKVAVRNYRKAIEETRQITANLKRRLERPDLPENERRWLEQIYAYQLILHQGWRHLAEYKAGTTGGGAPKPEA